MSHFVTTPHYEQLGGGTRGNSAIEKKKGFFFSKKNWRLRGKVEEEGKSRTGGWVFEGLRGAGASDQSETNARKSVGGGELKGETGLRRF